MCRYATISKSQVRRTSEKYSIKRNADFSFSHELNLLFKVTGGLWACVALSSLFILVGMSMPPKVDSHGEYRAGSLLAPDSSWRPGEYQAGECGALQDLNMRRADNGELNQLVNNPPPGYEIPYKQPQ